MSKKYKYQIVYRKGTGQTKKATHAKPFDNEEDAANELLKLKDNNPQWDFFIVIV